MNTIHVNTQNGTYDVHIFQSLKAIAGLIEPFLDSHSINILLVDEKVRQLYEETCLGLTKRLGLREFVIPGGERSKTWPAVEQVVDFLLESGCDRKSTLVILGGGTIGDLGGFCAGITLRGIQCIQIPTTLLSQVDSSIGGKTAINHTGGKNLIGLFYQPSLVCICTEFLKTLPEREFVSGLGEVIKTALIGDPELFAFLLENYTQIKKDSSEHVPYIVGRSLLVKKEIVEEDTTEKGRRMVLNFGHTTGHAFEKLSEFKLAHGEAVIAGMLVALNISCESAGLTEETRKKAARILQNFIRSFNYRELSLNDVIQTMKNDKKWFGGNRRFIVLRDIGRPEIIENIPMDTLERGIGSFLSMQSA